MEIINIKQYVGELDILSLLKPQPYTNLLVAPTGSGKSTALLSLAERNGFDMAFVSPFTSINEQMQANFPNFQIQTGTKETEMVSFGRNTITTFHSIVRLLEMDNIDILVIDEIHVLVNYAGYASTILNPFWDTLERLKSKHPHMKIVAATGTPQFIRMYPRFNFHEIIVKPEKMLGDRIGRVEAGSWKNEYPKDSYICLYPSRKVGAQQAAKHGGSFVESTNKETNAAYQSIISKGELTSPRLFTSTLLATGVSILTEVDKVIVNWSDLVDTVQFAARPRKGYKKLLLTGGTFWHERGGVDPVLVSWSGDFARDMKLLLKYQQWISYMARVDLDVYVEVVRIMLTHPEQDIVELMNALM